MNTSHLSLRAFVIASSCAAVVASGDVVVLQRESKVFVKATNGLVYTSTYTALGPGVTIAAGQRLDDNVSSTGISGDYTGNSHCCGTWNPNSWWYSRSLTAKIQVRDVATGVSLGLYGAATPYSWAFNPSNLTGVPNAYFAIVNDATGTIEFDSHLVASTYDFSGNSKTWNGVNWSGTLKPGVYRVYAGGNGNSMETDGPGAGQSGSGQMYVDLTYNTDGAVLFDFPNGEPTVLPPSRTVPVFFNTTSPGAAPIAGTGAMYFRLGSTGAFTQARVDQAGANRYIATMPSLACNSTVEYYFTAKAASGATLRWPQFGVRSAHVHSIADTTTYNSESGAGFSVQNVGATAGFWTNAMPNGDLGLPTQDYDGSGKAWVTGTGANVDVDGGETNLLTPALDCAGYSSVLLTFASAWYTNSYTSDKGLWVSASSNGGTTWIDLGGRLEGTRTWKTNSFTLDKYGVAMTNNLKVRFSARDYAPDLTIEAMVDAISLTKYRCVAPCRADFNTDGGIDFTDFDDFVTAFEAGSPTSDANRDQALTYEDFDAFVQAFEVGC